MDDYDFSLLFVKALDQPIPSFIYYHHPLIILHPIGLAHYLELAIST